MAAGGRHTRSVLTCLAVLLHRRVDYSGALRWLQVAVPSPPTCVAGTSGASFLLPGISSCSDSLVGGLQDAPGECSGACGQADPGFYSWLFLVVKVTGAGSPSPMSALHGFVTLTGFEMGTVAFVLGSIRKGYCMCNSKFLSFWNLGCIFSFVFRGVCTSSCPVFRLSTALQVFTRVFALVPEWPPHRGV